MADDGKTAEEYSNKFHHLLDQVGTNLYSRLLGKRNHEQGLNFGISEYMYSKSEKGSPVGKPSKS